MKRSEMVQKIEWLIDDNGHLSSSHLADLILDTVEESMLPPFNHELYYRTWRNGGTGREWEKE